MRILVFSSLFPNAVNPQHGIFVANRLEHLLEDGTVRARIVAPVPWFPFKSPRFGTYGAFARVPARESWHDIPVAHPRYPVIPKVGMSLAPALMARWTRAAVQGIRDNGFDFDLIDAHYFYPDGVAAVRLGALLDRPVVITARGTDLNVLPDFPGPRRQIIDAARRATGLITVSAALRDRLADLGIPADRVRVLRNGVDMARFHPGDREDRRRRFGLDGPTVVSVGNLVPLKGHDLVIRALADLPPDTRLLIAGDGPERAALEGLAGSLGLAGRVTLMGRVAPADMPALYGAADVLVLASSREGLPNVLLEALASGTPVVSTRVGGTPEVVTAPQAGRLVADRTPQALAAALADVLHAPPDRAATRAFAERFGWAATTGGQIALFQEILNGNRAFGDQKGTPQGLETPPKAE